MTPPRESKQQASWQRGFQDGPSNEDMLGTGEDANSEKMKRPGPRLFHTLAACTRCRSRKTRCDTGLPKCGPCERSGATCEFFDTGKQKTVSRNYIVHLQKKVRALEEEIKHRETLLLEDHPGSGEPTEEHQPEDHAQELEQQFVGSASGITVTRLVLESAKKDLEPEAFKDFTVQYRNPAKGESPEDISGEGDWDLPAAPATRLPQRKIGHKLVEIYCQKASFMFPVLHEPTFLKDVNDVYGGDRDVFKNFQLNMVLALSLQKYNSNCGRLADGYFLAGLQNLEAVMEPMDHRTLQSLLVMLQYALAKPTRIAAYHITGICVRLAIDLGYHQEQTIMLSEHSLDPLAKDMRRRVFWTLASMEYGLSHILGRPSGFATADAHVDMKFYEPVDDEYITANGILPTAPLSPKKLISIHFFQTRRLQEEIRLALYQNPRPTPETDKDPWFSEILDKLEGWRLSRPPDDCGSDVGPDWFEHRYNGMIIFLYRPSPQIPRPSLEATLLCYDAAVKNVLLEKRMFEEKRGEFTWAYLHQMYTGILAIIWAVYNREIRKLHSRDEVKGHINTQLSLLRALGHFWPGAETAADLFARLAAAALKNYDNDLQDPSVAQPSPVQPFWFGNHAWQAANSPTHAHSDSSHSHENSPSPSIGEKQFSAHGLPYPMQSYTQDPAGFVPAYQVTAQTIPLDSTYQDVPGMVSDTQLMQSVFATPYDAQMAFNTALAVSPSEDLQGWTQGSPFVPRSAPAPPPTSYDAPPPPIIPGTLARENPLAMTDYQMHEMGHRGDNGGLSMPLMSPGSQLESVQHLQGQLPSQFIYGRPWEESGHYY